MTIRLLRSGRRLTSVVALSTTICLISACATNPVTGKREFVLMSEGQEIELGKQADRDIRQEMGVYEDRALQQYVSDIGMRLAGSSERPNLPWSFAVVDTPVVNAFALPGGFIYVTRGLMAHMDTESQLAAVLGHEIGHVTARHGVRSYTNAILISGGLALTSILAPKAAPYLAAASVGVTLLFLKFDRNQERQADRLGTGYIARRGWAPAGMSGLLAQLGRLDATSNGHRLPGWLLTHPQPEDRVATLREVVAGFDASSPAEGWTVNRDAYWARLPGLMYGDNPRDGVVQANRFIHPDMRFQVAFPQGWSVENSKSQVAAQPAGDADTRMMLEVVNQPLGGSIDDAASAVMDKAGYVLLGGDYARVNGLQAYVGTYEGGKQDGPRQRIEAGFISYNNQVFMLAGIAPPDRFFELQSRFDRAIESFAPIGREEAAAHRPSRLAIITVESGDTWQRIAERTGRRVSDKALAVMNGFPPTEPPPAGRRIKTVVGG
jgi:predicted Zn-dependent protease